jgi:hypothetical protein
MVVVHRWSHLSYCQKIFISPTLYIPQQRETESIPCDDISWEPVSFVWNADWPLGKKENWAALFSLQAIACHSLLHGRSAGVVLHLTATRVPF